MCPVTQAEVAKKGKGTEKLFEILDAVYGEQGGGQQMTQRRSEIIFSLLACISVRHFEPSDVLNLQLQ